MSGFTMDTILGRAFAMSDAEHQGEMLNAVGKMARHTWDRHSLDMQCCRIADYLDMDGVAFIKTLHEFVKDKR